MQHCGPVLTRRAHQALARFAPRAAMHPRKSDSAPCLGADGPCWKKPVLLFSDIDDTMLGSYDNADVDTKRFQEVWNLAGSHSQLVYNTGRSLESFQYILGLKVAVMAAPDWVVCGVGTRIYAPHPTRPGEWCEDEAWTQHISEGWDIKAVQRALHALIDKHGEHRLRFTDPIELHEHKQTVQLDAQLLPDVINDLEQQLGAAGVRPLLVHGGAHPWGFIDVVPSRAGKGNAVEWVRGRLEGRHDACVVAGDSHNDVQALHDPRWHAIVVSNAVPSLRAWAQEQQEQHGGTCSGDEAVGNGGSRRVVLAKAPAAGGLLDGLECLGFLQGAHTSAEVPSQGYEEGKQDSA